MGGGGGFIIFVKNRCWRFAVAVVVEVEVEVEGSRTIVRKCRNKMGVII